MSTPASPYFLFPHTLPFEQHYRHLSVLFPQVSVLQVIRPSESSQRGQELFVPWPVIREPEKRAEVEMYMEGYRNLAELHGGDGILASMNQLAPNDPLRESRFRIQSVLRGKETTTPDIKRWLWLEAAIFTELARDLDEKEKEMEVGFSRLDQLEEEFREVLGITEEDELEEVIEITSPPLFPDYRFLSFMLPKRIACWYRLLAAQPPESSICPVALTEEVVEELFEPLQTEWERNQKSFEPVQIRLATLPSLMHLSPEDFQVLTQELETSEIPARYYHDLGKLVENPEDDSLRESLTASAEALKRQLELFCREKDAFEGEQIHLILTYLPGCSHNDFWRKLDKAGYEHLRTETPFPAKDLILYLE